MSTIKHIFQRHSGIVILTLSLILIFILLYLLRNILLPFLIGLVIAFILLPIVTWLERHLPGPERWKNGKRISAIVIVFMLLLVILGTAGYYVVTTTINSVTQIIGNAPDFISRAFETIQGWVTSLQNWLPDGSVPQVDNFVNNLGSYMGSILQFLFKNVALRITGTISFLFGFTTLPIFLYYVLKDHEHLSMRCYSWLPENAKKHCKNVFAIIAEVLGGYLRAQLTMGLFVGVLVLIGLLIIGSPLAVGLAVIAGVTEMVPILGPWIGGGIAVLVTLAIDPSKVIWVGVLYVAIQIIENALLVPRIQGHFLQVHPAVAVVLIIGGAAVAGIWGLILIVPLASMVVRLYRYVIKTAGEEDHRLYVSPTPPK